VAQLGLPTTGEPQVRRFAVEHAQPDDLRALAEPGFSAAMQEHFLDRATPLGDPPQRPSAVRQSAAARPSVDGTNPGKLCSRLPSQCEMRAGAPT
jgi:hypothetical protein